MGLDLAFTPSGRLTVVELAAEGDAALDGHADIESDGRLRKAAKAFEVGQGAGLFLLATERLDGAMPPSFVFWRDFAARYLTALCHTPEGAGAQFEAVPPPETADLAALVLNVPPIQGAEYVSSSSLVGVWDDLDAWVRGEVAAEAGGLSGFLKRRAPLWHQVGRVCFHLAENRRDENI